MEQQWGSWRFTSWGMWRRAYFEVCHTHLPIFTAKAQLTLDTIWNYPKWSQPVTDTDCTNEQENHPPTVMLAQWPKVNLVSTKAHWPFSLDGWILSWTSHTVYPVSSTFVSNYLTTLHGPLKWLLHFGFPDHNSVSIFTSPYFSHHAARLSSSLAKFR